MFEDNSPFNRDEIVASLDKFPKLRSVLVEAQTPDQEYLDNDEQCRKETMYKWGTLDRGDIKKKVFEEMLHLWAPTVLTFGRIVEDFRSSDDPYGGLDRGQYLRFTVAKLTFMTGQLAGSYRSATALENGKQLSTSLLCNVGSVAERVATGEVDSEKSLANLGSILNIASTVLPLISNSDRERFDEPMDMMFAAIRASEIIGELVHTAAITFIMIEQELNKAKAQLN